LDPLVLRNFSRSIGFETLRKESFRFLAFCSILALRRGKVSAYRTFRPAFAEWLVVTSVNLLVRMSIQSSQAAVVQT
jgi:hypothetical protein